MNIIDRSPLKMTTQEALYVQCSRRMKEAKSEEEKASIIQNFADQLRMEKLRGKRLQENMRQLNDTIQNSSPADDSINGEGNFPFVGGSPADGQEKFPPAASTPLSSKFTSQNTENASVLVGADSMKQQGSPSSWQDPYLNGLDLSQNEELHPAGNYVNGSMHQSDDIPAHNMKRRLSESASSCPQTGLSSRPLNVNAAPFVPKKIVPTSIRPPITRSSTDQVASDRRISDPFAPAVAPKSLRPLDLRSVGVSATEFRARSSSTGPQQEPSWQPPPNSVSKEHFLKGPDPALDSSAHPIRDGNRKSMPFGGLHQLDKLDGIVVSRGQKESATNVKGETPAAIAGSALLNTEDWDLEYEQQQQQDQQENVCDIKRKTRRHVLNESSKDWLAILKERDDLAKRRYSREKMAQICLLSDICTTRPSSLPSEYYNESGLWSPDLWFHDKFNISDQRYPQRGRPGGNHGKESTTDLGRQQQLQSTGVRINSLSAFQEKKREEARPSSR